MKTLYLLARGANFFKNDISTKNSDVGNYRLTTFDYDILGNDENKYFVEFMHSVKYDIRDRNYKTGKKIKRKVTVKNENALNINLQYENSNGTWANCPLENHIRHCDFSYTKQNILAVVNLIAKEKYDSIEIIDSLPFF